MSSCDLSHCEREVDIDEGTLFHYCEAKKVSTKATCKDCLTDDRKKQYRAYPVYTINKNGDEVRANKTWYLCEDCYSLSEAFSLTTLGSIRDTLRDNFEDCYKEDFDIELLDKLTPNARDFILGIIEDLEEGVS